jgi:hypothetical protein
MNTPRVKALAMLLLPLLAALTTSCTTVDSLPRSATVGGTIYIRDVTEDRTCGFELKNQTVRKSANNRYTHFDNCNTWAADEIWLEHMPSAVTITLTSFNMYKMPSGWRDENPCYHPSTQGPPEYRAVIKSIAAKDETLKFSIHDILAAADNQIIVPGVILKSKFFGPDQLPFDRISLLACIKIEPST